MGGTGLRLTSESPPHAPARCRARGLHGRCSTIGRSGRSIRGYDKTSKESIMAFTVLATVRFNEDRRTKSDIMSIYCFAFDSGHVASCITEINDILGDFITGRGAGRSSTA